MVKWNGSLEEISKELDELFEESNQEREKFYRPYWKAKASFELLEDKIKRTEAFDKRWEEFISEYKYWSDWYDTIQNFTKISDLNFYCLKLMEIIDYKDKVSHYGSKRDIETIKKVDKFAWSLVNMNRENFHNNFGGFYDKRIENYMMGKNADGTLYFYNSLFFNLSDVEVNNESDSTLFLNDVPSSEIILEREETDVVQEDNDSSNPSGLPSTNSNSSYPNTPEPTSSSNNPSKSVENQSQKSQLQSQISNLENKPNKTPQEEQDLKDKKNELERLNNQTPQQTPQSENAKPNNWLPPVLIIGGGLLVVGLLTFLIFKESAFQKRKEKWLK